MADIHIFTEKGDPVPYPEERIADLLRHGHLTLDTLYWRDGMTEWEPLETFRLPPRPSLRRTEPLPAFAAYSSALPTARPRVPREPNPIVPPVRNTEPIGAAVFVPSGPPQPKSRPRRRFRRNPQPLTLIVQVVLVVCLIVTGLELNNGLKIYQLASATAPAVSGTDAIASEWSGTPTAANTTPDAPEDPPYGDKHLFRVGRTLGYAAWGALLLLPVPYFMWLYRTTLNCLHFSSLARLKPGWVVADYFIPFVNLFRPCQTMQDIWRVSGHPRTWLRERGSVLVIAWWVLTIVTIGLSIEATALNLMADTRNDRIAADLVFLILKGGEFAWLLTFLAVVTLVLYKQRRIVALSRQRAEAAAAQGEPAAS